ncbi:MAG TPA: DUF2127 domain-containing protein, partial [Candidatus Paceibacterota bacterium]|nr:DUF2127 domain-containing protein [Candidatus Paceibacterota bacterium]
MTEKNIHRVFVISLILKSLNALVETLLGLLLLFTGGISDVILDLIRHELIEDPNDYFAGHLSGLAAHLSPGLQLYGAIYLLSHGVVKIFLVWGLIKDRLWAYPAS